MNLSELLDNFIRNRIADLGAGVFGLPAGVSGEKATAGDYGDRDYGDRDYGDRCNIP